MLRRDKVDDHCRFERCRIQKGVGVILDFCLSYLRPFVSRFGKSFQRRFGIKNISCFAVLENDELGIVHQQSELPTLPRHSYYFAAQETLEPSPRIIETWICHWDIENASNH